PPLPPPLARRREGAHRQRMLLLGPRGAPNPAPRRGPAAKPPRPARHDRAPRLTARSARAAASRLRAALVRVGFYGSEETMAFRTNPAPELLTFKNWYTAVDAALDGSGFPS